MRTAFTRIARASFTDCLIWAFKQGASGSGKGGAGDALIEIDESYYGGRGKPESRGRGLTDPNKSLMAIAVETVPASPRQGEGIKKSHFVAGSARIAVLPAATAANLGGFVRGAAKPGARIITDGLKSYDGLADSFRHYSIVQDGGKNADAVLPIVHVLFSVSLRGRPPGVGSAVRA